LRRGGENIPRKTRRTHTFDSKKERKLKNHPGWGNCKNKDFSDKKGNRYSGGNRHASSKKRINVPRGKGVEEGKVPRVPCGEPAEKHGESGEAYFA